MEKALVFKMHVSNKRTTETLWTRASAAKTFTTLMMPMTAW
jgi:hypothetical protein